MPRGRSLCQLGVDAAVVESSHYSLEDTDGSQDRTVNVRATNLSGQWVDVVVDRAGGSLSTGHFDHGETRELSESSQLYLNEVVKITRWRAGAFGIAGNGGGEVTFEVPREAYDVQIDLEIVG